MWQYRVLCANFLEDDLLTYFFPLNFCHRSVRNLTMQTFCLLAVFWPLGIGVVFPSWKYQPQMTLGVARPFCLRDVVKGLQYLPLAWMRMGSKALYVLLTRRTRHPSSGGCGRSQALHLGTVQELGC